MPVAPLIAGIFDKHKDETGDAMNRLLISLASTVLLASCSKQPAAPPAVASTAEAEQIAPLPTQWEPAEYALGQEEVKQTTDLGQFFASISKDLADNAKGEFETTADFEKRKADVNSLLSVVRSEQPYLFLPQYHDTKYNADEQAYEAYSLSCYPSIPVKTDGANCRIGATEVGSSQYSGQNAFGARAEVREKTENSFYFVVPTQQLRDNKARYSGYDYTIAARCPIKIEDARGLEGDSIRIAYSVSVRKAEMWTDTDYESATVSSPTETTTHNLLIPVFLREMICYSARSGKVIYRRTFE